MRHILSLSTTPTVLASSLAPAPFNFTSSCLDRFQVSDAAAVMEIFSDGRQLEVVPLLQAFMFPAW